MYHPVTFHGHIGRRVHQYKHPSTTSETTKCGWQVPDVINAFAIDTSKNYHYCEDCDNG